MSDVKTKGDNLPSRVILHGVEGVGKTSFAAHAPAPVFLMARGETGLETLVDAGQLGETPHLPEVQGWSDLLSAIRMLHDEPHDRKTLVIDTFNGCERLCHEFVCARQFKGDWGKEGFGGYQRGYEVSLSDWRELLTVLDRLREHRRMGIIALCHTKVKSFKNPEGSDYDRYQPDMHEKTWGLTHKWADVVLFAQFETFVEKESKSERPKGAGGDKRLIKTRRTAAWDAKNRHGLPPEIDMGNNGREAWATFANAMKAGREQQVKE